MDIFSIQKFQEDLVNFINKYDNMMLQHKYLILLNTVEKIKRTLLQQQYKLQIDGLKQIQEKLQKNNFSSNFNSQDEAN